VSVGEVQAAAPLINALLARFPTLPLVLTTGTATGRARARALWLDRVPDAGFTSASHFSRCYRATYGRKPSDERAGLRQ